MTTKTNVTSKAKEEDAKRIVAVPSDEEIRAALDTVSRYAAANAKESAREDAKFHKQFVKDAETIEEYEKVYRAVGREIMRALPDNKLKSMFAYASFLEEGAWRLRTQSSPLTKKERNLFASCFRSAKKLLDTNQVSKARDRARENLSPTA